MQEPKIDFIEKVINIMRNNELTEVTLEDEDKSLYIRTNGFSPVVQVKEKEENIQEESIKTEEKTEKEEQKKLFPVVSNMIGLFFIKPSPDAEPFVKVGDKVKKGQQIGIIETIKLMNKISSEVSGTVKEICIENGMPVEYGQTMMYIEQD